ncbi:hypothetical protein MTR67_041016 [Solanum verrucosum]|nr:hypothetical protein MTR67_041016 [Solanum verrucosum]
MIVDLCFELFLLSIMDWFLLQYLMFFFMTSQEFNKKSNSLYTILRSSRLAGSQRAPFLRQFLLRLNFNSFFEATARGVLNVVNPRPSVSVLQ